MSTELLKLRPEIKAQWLTALRSGEYTQCQNVLQDTTGFCCLGVLSDLHSKATGDDQWRERFENCSEDGYVSQDVLAGYTYIGEKETPPVPVMEWAFENFEPDHDRLVGVLAGNHCIADTLAGMNDDGSSFQEIADMIERVL